MFSCHKCIVSYENLPNWTQKNFYIDMISEELQSTNELEGVPSSKEEIVRTTRKTLSDNDNVRKVDGRFINVIKSYFELMEGNLKPPLDPEDCRKIYDEITSDGISKENIPDGKYFRKEMTYIKKNNKVMHRRVFVNNFNRARKYI